MSPIFAQGQSHTEFFVFNVLFCKHNKAREKRFLCTKATLNDGWTSFVEASSLSLPPIPGVLFDLKPYSAFTARIVCTFLLITSIY